jgi:hypothetical protein
MRARSLTTGPLLHIRYTGEVFYRACSTPYFAITPDLQLQSHPTRNRNESALRVFNLWVRLPL